MNNRLTIKDLAGVLSKKSGKDAESLERFLTEFISIIRENIFSDKLMQIKGIGTFKIIQVDSRESVDVNTKERIVIPSHSKISFTPDKDLREMVNKPFSFFESIEINEDSDFTSFEMPAEEKEEEVEEVEEVDETDEVVEETKDVIEKVSFIPEVKQEEPKEEIISSDIPLVPPPPMPIEKEIAKEEIQEEVREEIEDNIQQEIKEVEQEIKDEIKEEIIDKQEEETINNLVDEPIINKITENKPIEQPLEETVLYTTEKRLEAETKEKEITDSTNQIKKDNMSEYNDDKRGRDTYTRKESGSNNTLVTLLLILVVILIIALGSILFINRDKLFGSDDTVEVAKKENMQNQFSLPVDPDEDTIEDEWGIEDEYAQEKPATVTSDNKEGVITTVTTKRGDRLNLIALEYYGNKLFWVYIYEHNKSKIANPDNIDVGIQLEIPAKRTYNIDANDPASVKRASVKQSEIMSKYKPKRRRSSYSQYKYSDPYMYQYSDPYQYSSNTYSDPGLYNNNQYSDPFQSTTNQYNDYNSSSSTYDNNSNSYDNNWNNSNTLNNSSTYSDPFYF